MKWNHVKDGLPQRGVLCLVFFPIGVNTITEQAIGHVAAAYYRQDEKTWIYADTPRPLSFDPAYWAVIDEKGLPYEKQSTNDYWIL